jgi:putative DNA primase/helicase
MQDFEALSEHVKKINSQYDKKLFERIFLLEAHTSYEWSDMGFSRLFAHINSDFCCYNTTAREWYIYNGKVWKRDDGGMSVLDKVEDFYIALIAYYKTIEDNLTQNAFKGFITNLGKFPRRETLLKDSRDQLYKSQEDFDKNDDLFNCQNGTLNLKTFEFKPHDPSDFLTKISNVHYDPDAKSPLFEKFIDEVMQSDTEKTEYLQKAHGYGLTADTHYETSFILYGATKRNGKSTLMSTIMHALGDYAMDMKPESLAVKKNVDSRQASGDIARLDGCRFLNVSEPPKRMLLDTTLLKQMTGRDPITARRLHESEFTFFPRFKVFMNTNHLPLVTDDDLFASDRVNIITFDRHFKASEQDKTLKDKLITPENISGIFNWCLQGLHKFNKDGLEPPQTVRAATEDYKNDSDKIGKFIADRLEKTPGKNCKAGEVYVIYQIWCEANGYGCENKGNFFADLKYKKIFAADGRVDGEHYQNIVRGYIIKKSRGA